MAKSTNTVASRNELAANVQSAVLFAIASRADWQAGRGDKVSVEWARLAKKVQTEAFPKAIAALGNAIDFETFCNNLANTQKGETYIQAKVAEKCFFVIFALAEKRADMLGDYLCQVFKNALDNGGQISMQGAQASLSKKVARTGEESIKSRANNTVGTASAQASQARMAPLALGMASCRKGAKGDVMVFTADAVKKLQALFA